MEIDKTLTPEIIWQMFAENAASQKEIAERFKETDKKFQETDKKFQETRTMINQMRGHFDKQIGKLVEALIDTNTINLFKEAGIDITYSKPNPESVRDKLNMEFDLMLLNGTELVVIEAKVSLNTQKVHHFAKKMEQFKYFFKEFTNYKVYAAMACITSKSDARELAEENGFYLLKLKDEEFMQFDNKDSFRPKAY